MDTEPAAPVATYIHTHIPICAPCSHVVTSLQELQNKTEDLLLLPLLPLGVTTKTCPGTAGHTGLARGGRGRQGDG
jgi:hypothetical protein